jgi:hypothetical protein
MKGQGWDFWEALPVSVDAVGVGLFPSKQKRLEWEAAIESNSEFWKAAFDGTGSRLRLTRDLLD